MKDGRTMPITTPSSRFDYVRYDDHARDLQSTFKEVFERLEFMIQGHLPPARAGELALTSLEEAYCWIGKAIRDDQIARGALARLQEGRDTS